MDSVKRSEITPSKSRLARTFAKVLHIRAVTDDEKKKKRHSEKTKRDVAKSSDDEDEELRERAVKEAFLAKLFASISTVKAAYAQLQFSQSPYNADGIQAADKIVISELKYLSESKQSYLKKQLNDTSPETTIILSEIQEQRSLVKTYEITCKKLDSQVKLKDSEITFLQEKLADANRDIKLLEKRLNSSGQIGNTQLSNLCPSHFIAYFRQAVKSVRNFVKLMIYEMESAGWDLDCAASSIEPGVSFWSPNHKFFAFESFVCKQMLDGFDRPNFDFSSQTDPYPDREKRRHLFFEKFTELKSVGPADYLAWKPNSTFAAFCRGKYSRVVHPKMESSIFGNLNMRDLVNSGEIPETPFFLAFCEMVKRVWLMHCLALSFESEVAVFQVGRGACFSEVYMESLSDEAFFSSETEPRVAFTVVPGFRIGKTVIQCQVYLQ